MSDEITLAPQNPEDFWVGCHIQINGSDKVLQLRSGKTPGDTLRGLLERFSGLKHLGLWLGLLRETSPNDGIYTVVAVGDSVLTLRPREKE